MEEGKYFKKILSGFTLDVASGDAIRHLADSGYTVRQIMKRLDFPTPEDYVQRIVWEHCLEKGILCFEPGTAIEPKYTYIAEYNEYGHKSFRRVPVRETGRASLRETGKDGPAAWKEREYEESGDGPFPAFLRRLRLTDGEREVYVSCDFGLRNKREPERYPAFLAALEAEQREYLLGLPWERRLVYHRLDERMEGIVARLYEKSGYHGNCLRIKAGEKIGF